MYLIDIFGYVIELNLILKFRLRKRRKGEKRKGEGAKAPPHTFEGTLQKYKQNE